MVDTLQNIGPGDIVVLAHTQFKVYKVDVAAKRRTFYQFRYSNTGQVMISDHRPDGLRWPNLVLATFKAETVHMKTVATTFKGHARSSECSYHGLALFVSGDERVYREWLAKCKPSEWSGGVHDAKDTVVAYDPDKPKSLVNTRLYKKMDLICAVLMAHGPLTKDDILRRVCQLEGKPWVVGSNSEYFSNHKQMDDSIKEFGKIDAKKGWYVTEKGVSRGSQVLADIGLDVVKSIA